MRAVVALGGNALLERRETPDAEVQLAHVTTAARALAPIAERHEVVLTHGNGPQVGLLAAESAADRALHHAYPLDVLGAQTQGMIGYLLAQALGNLLPGRAVAALICQTVVDAADPAFAAPTKFVGPVLTEAEAHALEASRGWTMARDGGSFRRVVASPEPRAVLELETIRRLLDAGTLVVCAGGGGVPVRAEGAHGHLGVEAVIDKDLTAALLAQALGADLLVILTDVDAVYADFGRPSARPIAELHAAALSSEAFPAGSMGPKIEAARRFVAATGRRAAIGALADADAVLAGRAGTAIVP